MKKVLFISLLLLGLFSCIEEVDFTIDNATVPFVLIVEAQLTNEFKNHEVVLSRLDSLVDLEIDSIYNPFIPSTIREIDRDLINYEEGAKVSVVDAQGTIYDFEESSPGRYQSMNQFAAEVGDEYQLFITTVDNREFKSASMSIEGVAKIEELYAEKVVTDTGIEGIGIFVDNTTVSGNSKNVRFNYEETYKIISPLWSPQEFKMTNYLSCAPDNGILATYDLEIIPRQQEEQTCYGRNVSNSIIQSNLGSDLTESQERQMVHFIDRSNYIISHRYSILVEQQVVAQESFAFFEQLNNFSSINSIFSQVQPGFLEGNITASDGSTGSVVGFFDVVSVSQRRLFFDYTDFYPNEPLPPFPFKCEPLSAKETHISYCYVPPPPQDVVEVCPLSVVERIDRDLIAYYTDNTERLIGDPDCISDYAFVVRPCGDCTALGSNVIPEFWEE